MSLGVTVRPIVGATMRLCQKSVYACIGFPSCRYYAAAMPLLLYHVLDSAVKMPLYFPLKVRCYENPRTE